MISVRAACHVHSDWSYDGKWPLDRIAEAFSRRGYRVVMMTEHDLGFTEARRQEHREACRLASSDRILLVPGIEYADKDNCVHILVWGDVPFIGQATKTETVLAATEEAGGAAVFAHPSRREAWKRFNPEWTAQLAGIECWNRKTDGWAPSKDAWRLLQGTTLLPFVGHDFHVPRQFFPLETVLEVHETATEESVLAALRSRRVQPRAFSVGAASLANGFVPALLNKIEFLRRQLARGYRAWK